MTLVALFEQARHALARLGLRRHAEQPKTSFKRVDLLLGLVEVLLERAAEGRRTAPP